MLRENRSEPCCKIAAIVTSGFEAEPLWRPYLKAAQAALRANLEGSDLANPNMQAAVTHYQNTADNNVMMRERPGDKVQLFPIEPAPTIYCDPDKDGRGRVFCICDYRQHTQYSGVNIEHDCGVA
jgi:hypothetical protein